MSGLRCHLNVPQLRGEITVKVLASAHASKFSSTAWVTGWRCGYHGGRLAGQHFHSHLCGQPCAHLGLYSTYSLVRLTYFVILSPTCFVAQDNKGSVLVQPDPIMQCCTQSHMGLQANGLQYHAWVMGHST